MARVTVTIPDPLLEALDAAAAVDGKSRSAAVAAAVERWCEGRGTWPPGQRRVFVPAGTTAWDIHTATGAKLDAIAARTPAIARHPVPLRDGEQPPPNVWDQRPPPEGCRWETDAELRARILSDLREPNVGTGTTGMSAAEVDALMGRPGHG